MTHIAVSTMHIVIRVEGVIFCLDFGTVRIIG